MIPWAYANNTHLAILESKAETDNQFENEDQ